MDSKKYFRRSNRSGITYAAVVVRETKTQFVCKEIDLGTLEPTPNAREFRIANGRQIGSGVWWYACDSSELAGFLAENNTLNAAAKMRKDEQAERWAAKVAAVMEANKPENGFLNSAAPEFAFKDLNVVKFINGNGKTGVIMYRFEQTTLWDYDIPNAKSADDWKVDGFKVEPASYSPETWGHREGEYRFASHSSYDGRTVYDALVALVAASLWD